MALESSRKDACRQEASSEVHLVPKPISNANEEVLVVPPKSFSDQSKPKESKEIPKDFILSVARNYTSAPIDSPNLGFWGVLTAISGEARSRTQGMNIFLDGDEHWFGRLVRDKQFRIDDVSVSGKHCKLYRKRTTIENSERSSSFSLFLKDNSLNGTFLNWLKVKKTDPEIKVQHGDIISFVAAPHHDVAVAFVYRELDKCVYLENGTALKRKGEEFLPESKRTKGIGIGTSEGPISLDDVRNLQRSNKELRKQLESHLLTIEALQNNVRLANVRHESELKEIKESVSNSLREQIKELHDKLETKQKELAEISTLSAERQHLIEDLNEGLRASLQSRAESDEIMQCQKANIAELQAQLDEERNQRKEEREKALIDLRAAVNKAQLVAQEEIKRQSDLASRQHCEQQEIINKLQEFEKENRALIETLRSKLEDTRESLVSSENKVRHLETQLHEEQMSSAAGQNKAEMMEVEVRRLRKELENEKVAREEAWAKVSTLELEIVSAIRDLSIEKQRFQGARERLILRETQLRAFYSTTEEISALFLKQQEQLKAMQKTLEDEENYDNTSVEIDLNMIKENVNETFRRGVPKLYPNNEVRETSSKSKNVRAGSDTVSESSSATERHDCDIESQENKHAQDTQCTNEDKVADGFGSEINGIETVPVDPMVPVNEDPIDTERVVATQPQANDLDLVKHHFTILRCCNLSKHSPQNDETQIDENRDNASQSNKCIEVEDTEPGTIKTADLLTSEVAGSWAVSTAPSFHGENESPRSEAEGDACMDEGNNDEVELLVGFSQAQTVKPNIQERLALSGMIQTAAPEFNQFHHLTREQEENMSDADTEGIDEDPNGSQIVEDDETEAEDSVR